MRQTWRKLCLVAIVLAFSSAIIVAISSQYAKAFYDSGAINLNGIRWYEPGCDNSGVFGSCGNLPQETIAELDAAHVKEKVEQNMDRYKYAEQQTGVYWQAIAALHFREAGLRSDATILNGEPLTPHENADGQMISDDANADAVQAANILIDNARYFASVTNLASSSSTLADYGAAFATYKGGQTYRCNNKTFLDTTYVMNGYDSNHMNMRWQEYDVIMHYNPNYPDECYDNVWVDDVDEWLNNLCDNVGALAVFVYLGGCERVNGLGSEALGTEKRSGGSDGVFNTTYEFSWPYNDGPKLVSEATDSYQQAITELWGDDCITECYTASSTFISTILIKSEVDLAFINESKEGDSYVQKYLTNNPGGISYFLENSSNWEKITTSDYQKGDIIITTTTNPGATIKSAAIYMGDNLIAETDGHAPHVTTWNIEPSDNTSIVAYRFVGDDTSPDLTTQVSQNPNENVAPTGDWDAIRHAKNADKQSTDFEPAKWSDDDTAAIKRVLEDFGDLAYQTGRAVGVPYVAILVQMRYEDPECGCGKNNYWGNGCPPDTEEGGASIQASNLGEGFVQYGETFMSYYYDSVRGITDPKEYIQRVGPIWVGGNGYSEEAYMMNSIDAMEAFIATSEGQAIVQSFGSYVSASAASDCNNRRTIVAANVGEAARVPYEERMDWLFPDGVPTVESQMEPYLTWIEVPYIDINGNRGTHSLYVHPKLANEYIAIFEDLLRANFPIIPEETSVYEWRPMASNANSLSHHSYGVAMDINYNHNTCVYCGWGTYNPGTDPYAITREIADIVIAHGFYWGGDWNAELLDYMHFSYTNH